MTSRTATLHASLPHDARLRTQALLDEADQHWFTRHPDEPSRIRMYFLGEQVEADTQRARCVRVTRDVAGRLVRQFAATDEAAAS